MPKQGTEGQSPAVARAGYPLHAERPDCTDIVDESCATIRRAVARAAELARAGYVVEIGPPASPSRP